MNDRKIGFGLAHDGERGLLLFGGKVRRQRHGEQAALKPAGVMGPLRGECPGIWKAYPERIRGKLPASGKGAALREPAAAGLRELRKRRRGESLVRTAQDRERNPQYNQVKQRQTESVFCIYLHEAPFAFWVARNKKYGYGQEAS